MSHGKLRSDKTCQNCGHTVVERYCEHCGQENTETRQPFYFLFTHFLEDFTHYDGQFWRTIRYLIFVPGKLTNEYLAGKRQKYVAPVKLYIFISFIAFFIPSLFSNQEAHSKKEKVALHDEGKIELTPGDSLLLKQIFQNVYTEEKERELILMRVYDSIYTGKLQKQGLLRKTDISVTVDSFSAKNLKEYDSLAEHSGNILYKILKPFAHRFFYLKEKGYTGREIVEKFKESFMHVLPKALFIYLPIFAFFLWLFHNKKKWWFFDHGIFTLHFFSFLLLAMLSIIVFDEMNDWINNSFIDNVISLYTFVVIVYMLIYFFVAHRRVYQSSKRSTVAKGFILFIINVFMMLLLLVGLALFSFMTLH